MKINDIINEGKDSDPCWDNYKQVGMKKGKGGRKVPNCVPKEGVAEGSKRMKTYNDGIEDSIDLLKTLSGNSIEYIIDRLQDYQYANEQGELRGKLKTSDKQGVAEGLGGNWYIRVNGKILNDTKFKPVIFSSEDEARSHAMKLADKKRIPLSQMKLTKSWMDAPEKGVAEGLEDPAEKYKAHLLKTAPRVMDFLAKTVKGWRPSEQEMLGAIDTAYTVMKHTGDVKQAGKAMMDELNTLHRMSQGQQGVAGKGSQLEETYHDDDEFFEAYGVMEYNDETINEAEYQGRKVTLNKPMRGDLKKFKVFVKNEKGNVVKVNFGQKGARIKKNNPGRRKNFRARHNCDNPGPKTGARYWSCRAW